MLNPSWTRAQSLSLVLGLPLLAHAAPAPSRLFLAQPPAVAPAAPGTDAQDRGWPRQFEAPGYDVRVYAPQVDEWPNFDRITFRSAICVASKTGDERVFGVIRVSASTHISFADRLVVLADRKIEELSFVDVDAVEAERLKGILMAAVPPARPQTVSLDRLVAAVDVSKVNVRKVDVSTAPPRIYSSAKPAIMVIFMGAPRFQPVQNSDLQFAINTNWDVFLDPSSKNYYLLVGKSWLMTADIDKGPWVPAPSLPPSFSKLPADENWKDVRAAVPGVPGGPPPVVFVSHEPAELIVTDGAPALKELVGTSVMEVANTESTILYTNPDKQFYLLAAGRWFKSADMAGPWVAASDSLPADFKKIPDNPDNADILAAVPGTPAANDAIIMACIPEKATINRNEATITVAYDGAPKFQPIETTTVQYATNTPFSVFLVAGKYYCCSNAVWFEAAAPTGPWAVCTLVPPAIYTIPPTNPNYNVTYVQVYESTPTTVVTGYTAGYSGATVASTGVVMFGLGVLVGAALNDDCPSYRYNPSYYSYGCGAVYHGGYGGYVAGGAYYGPNGGAGHAAAYNPATGVYSRAGYAYGPNGAAAYRTAYNPATGTAAGHAAGVTPYGSWGSTAVTNGDKWATASHNTTANGTTGKIQTSSGAQAATVQGKYGNGATVAKSADGDCYAAKDGNVYKNTGSGWEQAGSGSSSQAKKTTTNAAGGTTSAQPKPTTTAPSTTGAPAKTTSSQGAKPNTQELQQQASARSRGEQSSARASQYQSGGGQRSAPSGGRRR